MSPIKNKVSIILPIIGCLLGIGLFFQIGPTPLLAQSSPDCSENYTIDQTFSANARWEFCWEHRNREGIVFHNVVYTSPNGTRRKVLKQAGLAQVHTPYDDNSQRYHYVTDLGLGGEQLINLQTEDCPTGELLAHQSVNVLCKEVVARGYIYKAYTQQRQGEYLSLYSVSDLGGQSLIVQWRFYDDGSIEPSVGSTGYLHRLGTDPQYGWPIDGSGTIGISYVNNYYWRLDFDIGENGSNDIVEEFNVTSTDSGSKKELSITQLSQETGRTVDPQNKRSWRIRDGAIVNAEGHSVSYHLEPMNIGNRYIGPANEPWTNSDIYFTTYNPCEQFSSHNPQLGGCGENVAEFANAENIAGADVVLWYRISYHHLPSSEYEPFIPVRWSTFLLIPRDWTANNEFGN